jgi:putative OPT family oligopeptide transporter
VVIPIYTSLFLEHNAPLAEAAKGLDAAATAGLVWSRQIRYLGVGGMLVGGIWTLIKLRKSLVSGVQSGLAATRSGATESIAETERDLPMKWILIGIVAFTLPLFLLYQKVVGNVVVSLPMTIIMVLAGFLFCSVSAYMAGLVGSSNNPVSGITIATILFAAVVLLLLMGKNATLGPVATIMIGAVVCCAASIAGDNLQDLKAGYLVGATPWKQQVMLAIGSSACALVLAPVLSLLSKAYGIGVPTPDHPNPLLAPQATLMASVSRGMFGGSLPWNMVAIGALIGVAIIVLDETLIARKVNFRVPVLAAAVGIYLPIDVTMPIFLGGLLAWFAERRIRARSSRPLTTDEVERQNRNGTLFAAGMITGEALMGIVIAIPIVVSGRADVLALPESLHFGQWLGIIVVGLMAAWLYRTAVRPAPEG